MNTRVDAKVDTKVNDKVDDKRKKNVYVDVDTKGL